MSALVHNVKTNRKVMAVCEIATYDVWGNDEDGYEVNETYREPGTCELPGEVTISNMPVYPGAKDKYREFPNSSSFSCEMLVSFELNDETLKEALGVDCDIDVDGDDKVYYVHRAEDYYPLGEIHILSWNSSEENN